VESWEQQPKASTPEAIDWLLTEGHRTESAEFMQMLDEALEIAQKLQGMFSADVTDVRLKMFKN